MEELKGEIAPEDRVIWMHCSSAGEFEQGKPVIEALKQAYPIHKIVVSFFSPSGYSVGANYAFADHITYLPLDTRKNAEAFIQLIHPELVIFVKYEFWYHFLSTAAFHHIPILLISASFRKDQVFFKSYGGFYRQILHFFRHIFVQDGESLKLLHANGAMHSSISGDTRFDRVRGITSNHSEIPFIKEFISNQKVIVAGSTWEGDERLLAGYCQSRKDVKLILAPHEINNEHLRNLSALFDEAISYSKINNMTSEVISNAQVLIIDSVGLLSHLYQYGTLTYIGGGFTKDGVHNTLEAAVWGKPVLFGPNYRKYREASELIQAGGGYSLSTPGELKKLADEMFSNEQNLQAVGEKARNYVMDNTGATERVLRCIQEKRLLTS